jgi:protein TonB
MKSLSPLEGIPQRPATPVGALLSGFVMMVLGMSMILWLLLAMNRDVDGPKKRKAKKKQIFAVLPPRPRPRRPKPRPRPRRAPRRRSTRAPLPNLATNLSNFNPGFNTFAATGIGQGSNALVGDSQNASDLVMTAKSVDTPPRPSKTVAPRYPARARSAGVSGYVTLKLLVNKEGTVEEAEVENSEPANTFDQVALTAIRRWRFTPARYKGNAVKVWVRQTMRFQLR